jgi:hypothetical protein
MDKKDAERTPFSRPFNKGRKASFSLYLKASQKEHLFVLLSGTKKREWFLIFQKSR